MPPTAIRNRVTEALEFHETARALGAYAANG